MSYHLFAGPEEYDEYTNGMEGYRGIFDTMEAAYKALGNTDNIWAQLAGVDPGSGKLYEIAALIDRITTPDESRKIISTGWLIAVSGTFIEMERRYQKLVRDEPPTTIEITIPGGVQYGEAKASGRIIVTGATPNFFHWVESDPF